MEPWGIFILVTSHMACILFSIAVNRHIWIRSRRTPQLTLYLILQGMMLIWMVAKVGKTLSPTIELRWAFVALQYAGSSFVGIMQFHFGWVCLHERPLPKPLAIPFWIPFVLFYGMVLTNPWHHLVYRTFTMTTSQFGPVFHWHAYATWGFLGLGLLMWTAAWIRYARQRMRWVSALFSAAILIPMVFNILYITNLYPVLFGAKPLFDYTPLLTSISLAFFAYAIFQWSLLDYGKVPLDEVLSRLPQTIVLADADGHLLDLNRDPVSGTPLLRDVYPVLETLQTYESPLESVLERLRGMAKQAAPLPPEPMRKEAPSREEVPARQEPHGGSVWQEDIIRLGGKPYRMRCTVSASARDGAGACLAVLEPAQAELDVQARHHALLMEREAMEKRLAVLRQRHEETGQLIRRNREESGRLKAIEQGLAILSDWLDREETVATPFPLWPEHLQDGRGRLDSVERQI